MKSLSAIHAWARGVIYRSLSFICGLVRASNILAHAADEFVYVEDLLDMAKELVYYLAA